MIFPWDQLGVVVGLGWDYKLILCVQFYVSNFVTKLANDFLLIIIIETPKLLIVVVEIISWVIWIEVTIMIRWLIV